MMRVLGFPDGKPLGWRSGRVAEGTPLLRAQINIYWSRGFESLLLRQQVSYFPLCGFLDSINDLAKKICIPECKLFHGFSFYKGQDILFCRFVINS